MLIASLSLEDRLIRFYREYADRIFDAQWMRIFMFAGLKGHPMTDRYVSLIRTQLIRPACGELRAELRLPTLASIPITAREEEAFWALHGMVFYLGIRKFIYSVRTHRDQSQIIEDDVRAFLAGAPRHLAGRLRSGNAGVTATNQQNRKRKKGASRATAVSRLIAEC